MHENVYGQFSSKPPVRSVAQRHPPSAMNKAAPGAVSSVTVDSQYSVHATSYVENERNLKNNNNERQRSSSSLKMRMRMYSASRPASAFQTYESFHTQGPDEVSSDLDESQIIEEEKVQNASSPKFR